MQRQCNPDYLSYCHKSLGFAVIGSLRSWRKTNSELELYTKCSDGMNSQLPAHMVYLVNNVSPLRKHL